VALKSSASKPSEALGDASNTANATTAPAKSEIGNQLRQWCSRLVIAHGSTVYA
jgi:hypothetical protein